jgi:hypothetical protein
LYLKTVAEDGYATPYNRIAEEMDIPVSQADAIIKQCVENMTVTIAAKEPNLAQALKAS